MMNVNEISFPNMGLDLQNVPEGFPIFGFEIKLYAICVVLGMFAGGTLAAYLAKRGGWDKEKIWDFFFYGVVFGVIGARIYYVIFAWDFYKDNPVQVFNLRQGGLAIYGGVIAAFTTVFIYCKVKKINPFRLLDYSVPGLALGQAFGRWGNFFNREVFGEYTDNFFAMRLPASRVRPSDISESIRAHMAEGQNYIQVHPTFLYECLWNLAIVALMVKFEPKKKFVGEVALWYLGGYGLGRFWIEGIRTDTLFIPGTTLAVSQVLAIIMFVGSLAADIIIRVLISKGKLKSIVFCEASSH